MEQTPSSLTSYKIIGALYMAAGLPAFVALIMGNLSRGGNPYFALSAIGVPLGLLLLGFGVGALKQTNRTDIGMRLGGAALFNLVFFFGARFVMQNWHPGFETAYQFFAVLVCFLSTLCLVLLLAGLAQRNS